MASPVTASAQGAGIRLQSALGSMNGASFLLTPEGGGLLRYRNVNYRGSFQVSADARGGVLLLNLVPLEDYLRGVVPAEMPALWPAEAVKAQAVAARTYALCRRNASRNARYDLTADVSDQIYPGTSREHPAADAAVQATAGMVITYNREPITAYYHSCSGGHTRNGTEPYLVGVPSPEQSPFDQWELEYTLAELARKLTEGGFAVGVLTDVAAVAAPDLPDGFRVASCGSGGRVELTPVQVRRLLGINTLRSPSFRVELAGSTAEGLARLEPWMRTRILAASGEREVKVRDCVVTNGRAARKLASASQVLARVQRPDKVRFLGGGYGHGLGMSQYGAKYMAEHGADWRAIIHHYYTGVEIVHLSEVGRMPAF